MCNLLALSKCCLCVPLRKGLIVWGYFRLVITVSYSMLIAHAIGTQFSAKGLALLLVLISFVVVNAVFTITFVIGGHKENYKLLRLYYYFSIFALFVMIMGYFIFITLQVALTLQDEEKYILGLPLIAVNTCTVTSIILDLYFFILIKIVILKEGNKRAYYVNGRGDNSFVLQQSIAKEQDKRCDAYSDSDSEDGTHEKSTFPGYDLERMKRELENKRI